MKRLLSILAAIGLTATASTAVVACGSGQNKDNMQKTVKGSFRATFATKPTNEELQKDFQITDDNNVSITGTYSFKADDGSADKNANGTVTYEFPITNPALFDKTTNFVIDVSTIGKKVVSNFTPVKIKVSLPVPNSFKAVSIKLSGDKVKPSDPKDTGTYYESKSLMVEALDDDSAWKIYNTLFAKMDKSNITNGSDAKAKLLSYAKDVKATDGNTKLEYVAYKNVTITSDTTMVTHGSKSDSDSSSQIIPDGSTYEIGFYNQQAAVDLHNSGKDWETTTFFYVKLTFDKTISE